MLRRAATRVGVGPVADKVHPALPVPMRGGQVASLRPLPPSRCIPPPREEMPTTRRGSVAMLHRDLLARDRPAEDLAVDAWEDEPTSRMARKVAPEPRGAGAPLLPAFRVKMTTCQHGAKMTIIAEDEDVPDDVPTAVLVPDSARDTAMLVRMLTDTKCSCR